MAQGIAQGRTQGAVAEAKKLLRVFGDRILGAPDARAAAAIDRIDDLARLEELCGRLPAVRSWQELLGQQAPSWGRR
jgi:hypothetical protein